MEWAESNSVAVKVKGVKGWMPGVFIELPKINASSWRVGNMEGDITVTHWIPLPE